MKYKKPKTKSRDRIPVFKPLVEKEEISAAVSALKLGWLGMGSYVGAFEKAVAKVCRLKNHGNRKVVAFSTGHAALHLALLEIGVGPGDEVITPSFNNAADFQAILACGAEPVFVDIKNDTLCLNPSMLEPLITPRTKAIIAMDYDIFLCDHAALKVISKKHGIPILHDAAHSFGSLYQNVPVGNQHPFTMFSFDPVKTITCIDGGALIVESDETVRRLQARRLLGMTQPVSKMYRNARAWSYDITELGFRYHMPNLHAAVGLAQISKIEKIRTNRQSICKRYAEELGGLKGVVAPVTDFKKVNPFLYYIQILNGRRDEMRKYLSKAGVETGIHWQAGHRFTVLKQCRAGPLDVTEMIVDQIVSLPLHSRMSDKDVNYVIKTIHKFK